MRGEIFRQTQFLAYLPYNLHDAMILNKMHHNIHKILTSQNCYLNRKFSYEKVKLVRASSVQFLIENYKQNRIKTENSVTRGQQKLVQASSVQFQIENYKQNRIKTEQQKQLGVRVERLTKNRIEQVKFLDMKIVSAWQLQIVINFKHSSKLQLFFQLSIQGTRLLVGAPYVVVCKSNKCPNFTDYQLLLIFMLGQKFPFIFLRRLYLFLPFFQMYPYQEREYTNLAILYIFLIYNYNNIVVVLIRCCRVIVVQACLLHRKQLVNVKQWQSCIVRVCVYFWSFENERNIYWKWDYWEENIYYVLCVFLEF
eukprot:TRINITY_DN12619_c0_g1_i2.p1 TRINITY_DN12619_c0_g1~~TRINITY_DN12619_c0_g1_i2.p1  ORF type:complete len:310 (+),score=-2.63 TRINITY_DN12619_c0_g1_i2:9-938(+)